MYIVRFSNGYLLIISLRTCFADFSQEMWSGTCLTVDLDADTELSLRYLQVRISFAEFCSWFYKAKK